MSDWIWCNGTLLSAGELRVSPSDRGLTVGLGLFETILAVGGAPVWLDRHLARHADGCRRLGWEEPSAGEIEVGMAELLRANGLTRGPARLRLYQTSGEGSLHDPGLGRAALTILTATALPPLPEGMAVTLVPWVRNERSPLAGLKCASYAENLLALELARARGCDEALFLNTAGNLCETATANLFLVEDGRLLTPPLTSGCLPGITRAVVLEAAGQLGIPAGEATMTAEQLGSAGEILLTSSLRGITPVTRLDGRSLGEGPVTARLREWLRQTLQAV